MQKTHTIMGQHERPSTSKLDVEPPGAVSDGHRLRVLALEPYFVISHRAFVEGYARLSRHEVVTWSLPGRKWKWRMRGSAFHFTELARSLGDQAPPDVVLASDFMNLADWHALAPRRFRDAPSVLYFHENQITYPLGAEAPRDHHYGWINLSSALAADLVLFNSSYHKEAFFAEAARVLERMPDFVPPGILESLRSRSDVFPVGVDFTPHRAVLAEPRRSGSEPTVVWNHRWEYDKGPELMADVLSRLRADGCRFRAVICGQSFERTPPVFAELESRLGQSLEHLGFFPEHRDYLRALRDADIVLSTARHEFFGVAVVEALYMGALPVLPRALSYPEIVPSELHAKFLYDGPDGLEKQLRQVLASPPFEHRAELQRAASRFDWRELAPRLDHILDDVYRRGRR